MSYFDDEIITRARADRAAAAAIATEAEREYAQFKAHQREVLDAAAGSMFREFAAKAAAHGVRRMDLNGPAGMFRRHIALLGRGWPIAASNLDSGGYSIRYLLVSGDGTLVRHRLGGPVALASFSEDPLVPERSTEWLRRCLQGILVGDMAAVRDRYVREFYERGRQYG